VFNFYWGGQSSYLQACQTNALFQTPRQYLSPCFQGYQPVRTGVAYAEFGIYTQSMSQESAHPQIKLLDTLKTGKTYCVTYYISLWNNAVYSIDKLGALLTPTPFPCATPGGTVFVAVAGLYTPQVVTTPGVVFEDTLNWMEVSGVFTAVGNQAYLALGDFFLHSQHVIKYSYPTNCNGLAEYYVDDVSIEEVQLAMCARDTAICPTDSVLLGANLSEATAYSWLPTNGLSCATCANPKASPNSTTTYTLTKTQCKAITTASITVTVKTDCNPPLVTEALEVPNVFTPNADGINDAWEFNLGKGCTLSGVEVYDRWGLLIKNLELNTNNYVLWDGRTTSGIACSEGVYYYTLTYKLVNGDTETKKGFITLIR
jgi:gliding motility-associated-like protein